MTFNDFLRSGRAEWNKESCNILLIPSASLLSIVDRAEALDREAMQVAGSIYDWMETIFSPRCVCCSAFFEGKQTGGWIVIVPASPDVDPTAVVGVCQQCIGRPDLLSRAFAHLEAETGIVVEPDCAGRA